jgi:hypothetical protein
MSTIFHLNDLDIENDDIDLDGLYERKYQTDLKKLEIYKKILQKIHNRVKITARVHRNQQWCWYQVPMMLLGVPEYNFKICIKYVIEKLKENGFQITIGNPNMLLVSWKDWIPSHVRDEIKEKLGKNIDGYGNLIITDEKDENTKEIQNKDDSKFKSIDEHKPVDGIYNSFMINKIEKINH